MLYDIDQTIKFDELDEVVKNTVLKAEEKANEACRTKTSAAVKDARKGYCANPYSAAKSWQPMRDREIYIETAKRYDMVTVAVGFSLAIRPLRGVVTKK